MGHYWVFWQDNDPDHMARSAQKHGQSKSLFFSVENQLGEMRSWIPLYAPTLKRYRRSALLVTFDSSAINAAIAPPVVKNNYFQRCTDQAFAGQYRFPVFYEI
ncbi:hypothetical protein XENORESO_013068 [Xenotaenia resolanae]|uniref:Uncharacterized protein n=1 Tax=Xenotaenia resolanae TaxID=208358 RepID=A0ABV0VQP7_9TELE